MIVRKDVLLLIGLITTLFYGTANAVENDFKKLFRNVPAEYQIAVAPIYDGVSGDVTALAELWRDFLENTINQLQLNSVTRKDIVLLMDEVSTFDNTEKIDDLLENSSVDVLVSGRYYLTGNQAELHLKVLKVDSGKILSSHQFKPVLPKNWVKLVSVIKSNIYHQKVNRLTKNSNSAPHLSARLNKKQACYQTGESSHLIIQAEKGSYIYILNMAADNTVTLLYPNRWLENNSMISDSMEFPPLPMRVSGKMKLRLYPLNNQPTNESMKIIASRSPLDFSSLPIPENAVFAGASGGEIKTVLNTLKESKQWRDVKLSYWVGPGCE